MMLTRRHGGARAAWWLCAFLAVSASLHAQTPADARQDDVPREFAHVLLMGGNVEFHVGRVAASLPAAEQLTDGARVIGSVVWRDRNATAIAVSAPVTEARALFEARLRAAGWTNRPPSDQPQRGFLPAYTNDPEHGFCWPETDAQLSVNIHPAPGGGSYIVLNYLEPRDGRHCLQPRPPQRRSSTVLESMMPSLRPPDGAVVTGRGGGGGGSEYEIRSAIRSQHSPAELVRHFGPQLEEQGWSITEQMTGDAMAIVAAHRTLDSGTTVLLWVSARRAGEEAVALGMRISPRSDAR
jgi:hypothetical protein